MHVINLKGYFSPEAVVQRLKALPPLKTTVLDAVFGRKVNHPFAKVGRDDLADLALPMPLIARGAPSLAQGHGSLRLDDFEPFEFAPNKSLTAADLNNLRLLDKTGIEARLSGLDDALRRICRASTEAIAATAITGRIEWPVRLAQGGYETYTIDFGTPHAHEPARLWDHAEASIEQVYEDLDAMQTAIQAAGYGGAQVLFWAGSAAYRRLLALAGVFEAVASPRIHVRISEKGVEIGNFTVAKMAEMYRNPQTGEMVPKVEAHKVVCIATDAVHTLFYCALDDLDGKLQPLPYYSKPIDTKDPSGVKIVGRSKPFPAFVSKACCWAEVVTP